MLLLTGCSREEVLDDAVSTADRTPFTLELPWYFPAMEVPNSDPLTVEGIALGRRLYYDALLSSNGPHTGKSCSTCHDQALPSPSPLRALRSFPM